MSGLRPTQYEMEKGAYWRNLLLATAAAVGMLATVAVALPPADSGPSPAQRTGNPLESPLIAAGWEQALPPAHRDQFRSSAESRPRRLPEIPPILLESAKPLYPEDALAAQSEGRVEVLATVSPNGRVARAIVLGSSGSDSLDEAAVAASHNFLFEPAMQGDLRVAASLIIPFEFRLE